MMKLFFMTLILSAAFQQPLVSSEDLPTISLRYDAVPLSRVLESISRQTGVNLIYPDELADSVLVTCDVQNIAVDKALRRLVRNTSIGCRKKGTDEYILFLQRPDLTVDIVGRVFDIETGEKLPSANISVKGLPKGTASNSEGHFLLQNMPFKPCELKVAYIGYATTEIQLDIGDLTQPQQIGLRQQSILTSAVTVTPELWQMLALSDVGEDVSIAPENFALLPSVGDKDIFQSLQLLPGISSANQSSSELYVRGGTPSQNLVLFDGMTLYHLEHSFGLLSAFNSDAIKDVRVYKSGFPAKYGGRLSSVINITAKSGDSRRKRAHFGVNLLNGHAVFEWPVSQKGALLLSLRRSYSGYIVNDLYDNNFRAFSQSIPRRGALNGRQLQTPEPVDSEPAVSFFDAIGKISVAPTEKDEIAVSVYASQDDLDRFETFDQTAFRSGRRMRREGPGFVHEEQLNWGNRGLSGRWSHQLHDRFRTVFLAAYSRFSSGHLFFENTAAFALDPRFSLSASQGGGQSTDSLLVEMSSKNRIEDLTFRLDNSWNWHDEHRLEFGSKISATEVTYTNTGFRFIDELLDLNQGTEFSGYIEDRWTPGHFFTLNGGLRITYFDLTASTHAEPRFSTHLTLMPFLSLKGSWGRNHQFVRRMPGLFEYTNGRDFWLLADSRAIQVGEGEHVSFGARLKRGSMLLDFDYYESRQKNVTEGIPNIQYLSPMARSAIFRDNTSFTKGVDVLLQAESTRFNGWISYGYSKTNITATHNQMRSEFPANHDLRHKLNLVGSYTVRGWNFSLTWTYASGAAHTIPLVERLPSSDFGPLQQLVAPVDLNVDRLPRTHRLDASINRSFVTPHLYGYLGFGIYNMYDKLNLWYRNYVIRNGEMVSEDVTGLGFTPTVSLDIRLR